MSALLPDDPAKLCGRHAVVHVVHRTLPSCKVQVSTSSDHSCVQMPMHEQMHVHAGCVRDYSFPADRPTDSPAIWVRDDRRVNSAPDQRSCLFPPGSSTRPFGHDSPRESADGPARAVRPSDAYARPLLISSACEKSSRARSSRVAPLRTKGSGGGCPGAATS